MNYPSLESYCNLFVLAKSHVIFLLTSAVFQTFQVILLCDVIRHHSTSCATSNQELFLPCWCMFWQSLVVIELFVTYLPHLLLTSHGPAHPLLYLITNLQIAINCCIIAVEALREGILNVDIVLSTSFFIFLIDVCIRQCIYLWAKHLCIHNLLIYR